MKQNVFENLFVLELANNHWGQLERGKRIIRDFASVARHNGVKVAIKLQFRDVGNFIHKDFTGRKDVRYVWKTEATRMSTSDYRELIDEIRLTGCMPMATPFDEESVELCASFDLPIIKIASSDINSWPLLEAIAKLGKPVIVSTGGAGDQETDNVVKFFSSRDIPIALNHCVSLYPSEDHELELNQIEYLANRYPDLVIGWSSHEQYDWVASMFISYAKGARTWERHIDIDDGQFDVSPYCTTPEKADQWFKAFKKAREMSGGSPNTKRSIPKREVEYLDALVRGVYARRKLEPGYIFSSQSFSEDFYLAVPLQKNQLSVREILNGERLLRPIEKDAALLSNDIDGPYGEGGALQEQIASRGLYVASPDSDTPIT